MKVYPSERSFEVGGQSYEGFPILVDNFGVIVELTLRFFVDELLGRSGARDLKTWDAYGRHLYDYFGYLEAKNLRWDSIPGLGSGDIPPLAHYVRWCDSTVGNKPSYINDKLGTIVRFYLWAQRVGLVKSLPFQQTDSVSSNAMGMLNHNSANPGRRKTTTLHMTEADGPIKVLSRSQIETVLRSTANPTHRAVVHLGLNAGLRAEELATFPAHYVEDCSKLSSKIKSVPVYLKPDDMDIKNDRPRKVRVSVECMNLLWQYREGVRPALQNTGSACSSKLFITRYGEEFAADGFVAPLARLGLRLGFHIHPHMLRHSFATHTLASLVLLCHKSSCAVYCRTGREPPLHEPLSKQDAQRSNGIRNVTLSALDCPGGCNPREGQAARIQGSFFYHVRLIAF
ncbi:site-specific recombinase XerD [Paraburkholderia sp. BL10I2N1]|nr:site-specific recombinase XerD [Paraburkholderia sp. BL10I2N1]